MYNWLKEGGILTFSAITDFLPLKPVTQTTD